MHSQTPSLDLARASNTDLEGLHEICSDPRVWAHFPSLRHDRVETTHTMVSTWIDEWTRDGLGTWILRRRGETTIVGYGGVNVRGGGAFWNLGYRISADSHGRGYATEGVRQAREVNPSLPIVAYLVEHNVASAKVAAKVGLSLRHRAPDAGNPDPDVVRLVYADRDLTQDELAAALG